MKAKAVRLPESLLHAVQFAEKREKLDEPTALRKGRDRRGTFSSVI